MKQALCLQHVPFEGPGVFEDLLRERGYRVERRLVPEAGLPDTRPDFLLVMGGPMSANDPDPWIREELDFMAGAVQAGVPYLGVCLGSQLLAKALGGSIYRGPRVEIGLTQLTVTEAGRADRAFRQLPPEFRVIEWHGEGIEPPPGAAVLARSADFPVQAFRATPRALGLLFHIELTPEGLGNLCANGPDDLARGGTTREALEASCRPELPRLNAVARTILADLLLP